LAEWTVPDCDVVHATTWAVPGTRRPLVVTVHDLAFRHEASHFTPHGVRFFERALSRVIDRASAVIVPSESVRDDCLDAGLDTDRVRVVPHGGTPNRATAEDVVRFRRRAGLDRPYLLWVGTREPRKNLAGVIEAYRSVAARLDTDLVLAGPRGWGVNEVVPNPGIHVLGRLDERDLAAAYAGARAFCFPSFREGFGLPVLEAMNAGLPVVTSGGTACAEVAAEAAILVDPTDTSAIAQSMVAATGERHDDLARASRARASHFTWTRSARLTAAVYRSVASDEFQ
jgi:glycosyltransferase involved in cell wall biosynthesis